MNDTATTETYPFCPTRALHDALPIYVDEASWSIAAVDCYDGRGQLWRFQEAHLSTFPFVPVTTGSPEVHYDLPSGRYFVTGSFAGDAYPDFGIELEDSYFRPQTLATRKLKR